MDGTDDLCGGSCCQPECLIPTAAELSDEKLLSVRGQASKSRFSFSSSLASHSVSPSRVACTRTGG